MYYKISALELELLAKDRNKILKQFRKHQVSKNLANINFLELCSDPKFYEGEVYLDIYEKICKYTAMC